MFKKNDIVIAKPEYIEPHETPESTVGIVLSYDERNDYLHLGLVKDFDKYAIPPSFSMRGEYYRLLTDDEKHAMGLYEGAQYSDDEPCL